MSVELLLSLVVAVGVIVAGYWALALLVVKQFERRLDDRFELQEQARREGSKLYHGRLERIEGQQHDLERAHLKLVGELPLHYVRREDYVRNQTVIEAKLDALALKFENWNLKEGRDA